MPRSPRRRAACRSPGAPTSPSRRSPAAAPTSTAPVLPSPAADLSFSRSIARQVAETGEAVVTVDAAGDDRFREAVSVSDLRLRSVLAVPLAVKGQVVGAIYVDHRLRRGAFDKQDVDLVIEF